MEKGIAENVLLKNELEILSHIEKTIKCKLPCWNNDSKTEPEFGYFIEQGHITQLGLCPSIPRLHSKNSTQFFRRPLKKIPSEISQLAELTHLNLKNNQIKEFLKELCLLKKLRVLDLQDNQISSLPNCFNSFLNLELLNLSYNNFQDLPDSIGKISTLKYLYVLSKFLQRIPDSLANLPNLRILDTNIELIPTFKNKLIFTRVSPTTIFHENNSILRSKHSGYVFLVGAGISREPPSNLPSAREMLETIWHVFVSKTDSIPKNLRYEVVMAGLQQTFDPHLSVLDYLDQDFSPNFFHIFLAFAIIRHQIVVTTNFDSLIEKALMISLQKNELENIQPVITNNDFKTINATLPFNNGKYPLFKLHGARHNFITNEDTSASIISTIDALKSEQSSFGQFKLPIMVDLLNHRTLIVLGYSGGDDMDIGPVLLKLPELVDITGLIWYEYDEKQNSYYEVHPPKDLDIADLNPIDQLLVKLAESGKFPVYKVVGLTTAVFKFFVSQLMLTTNNEIITRFEERVSHNLSELLLHDSRKKKEGPTFNKWLSSWSSKNFISQKQSFSEKICTLAKENLNIPDFQVILNAIEKKIRAGKPILPTKKSEKKPLKGNPLKDISLEDQKILLDKLQKAPFFQSFILSDDLGNFLNGKFDSPFLEKEKALKSAANLTSAVLSLGDRLSQLLCLTLRVDFILIHHNLYDVYLGEISPKFNLLLIKNHEFLPISLIPNEFRPFEFLSNTLTFLSKIIPQSNQNPDRSMKQSEIHSNQALKTISDPGGFLGNLFRQKRISGFFLTYMGMLVQKEYLGEVLLNDIVISACLAGFGNMSSSDGFSLENKPSIGIYTLIKIGDKYFLSGVLPEDNQVLVFINEQQAMTIFQSKAENFTQILYLL